HSMLAGPKPKGNRAERVQWTKQRRRGWRSAPVFARALAARGENRLSARGRAVPLLLNVDRPKTKGQELLQRPPHEIVQTFGQDDVQSGPAELVQGLTADAAGGGDQLVHLALFGPHDRNVGELGDPLADRREQGGALGAAGG